MASEDTENLADRIIRFLQTERELYGDFTVPSEQSERKTKKNVSAEQKQEVEQEAAASGKTAPSIGKSTTKKSKGMTDSKSQEHLFEESPDREIYSEIGKCNTLDELKALCKQAEELKTDLQDTNLVFGVGNTDADLMLIGEAPGAEEDRQGEPFVGAAGQLLNKILAAINFERDDVYIANILKHRPPNNRNPKPEEREHSLPFLLRQMDLIEPKLILCLGKVAAQTLLENDNSLKSMRGKFHSFRGRYELMATYHPAALLRHTKWKRPTWEDVQLLRDRYDELGCEP